MKFGKIKKNKEMPKQALDDTVTSDGAVRKTKKNFGIKGLKDFLKNKKGRRIFAAVLAAVIVLSAGLIWYIHGKNTAAEAKAVTAEVTRGNISNTIEGTGTVEAISQYEITSLAKGDVIADYFEEGDYVEKGQLLYKIDSSSVDKSIQRQQSSIEKAKITYNDAAQSISDLNVKSTVSGVITNLYVSVGDNVSNGAKIADVIDKNNLVLTIPFGADDARHIYSGESASVTLANSFTTLNGTVKSVGTGSYVNSYGVSVTDIEISLTNPGTVSEGEKATAMIGSYACYDSGEIEYLNSKTITAKTSGEVESIAKKKGDSVRQGDVIVRLSSSSAQKSVKEAQISLNDANLSLDDLYDNLDDYSITAPIKGKVIQKNIKAGEKLDSNSTTTMAIIADLSTLTFDISIDELDISSISLGQTVSIEADAIEGKTFSGTVSNISIVGESYQGVTSYPVTVTIDNSEESELIPGMNVSAKIVVESVENVLRVPVSALRMGNFVIVKDDGTFADAEESIKKKMQNRNTNAPETEKSQSENNDNSQNSDEAAEDGEAKTPPEGGEGQTPPEEREGQMPPSGDMPPASPDGSSGGSRGSQGGGKGVSSLFGITKAYAAEDENSKESRAQNMLKSLDVPDGYTVVMVETGLSDGSYIEIKETEGGLKEGDIVLLPDTTSSSDNSKNSQQNAQGGMGMPGGGMPGGGGMPSGGGMPGGGGMSSGGGNRGGQRQ